MRRYIVLLCLLFIAGCGVQATELQKEVIAYKYADVADANTACQNDPNRCVAGYIEAVNFLTYFDDVKMDDRQRMNQHKDRNMIRGELTDPNAPADHKREMMRLFTVICETWVERSN